MGNTVSHIDSDCNVNINAANLNNIQNHLNTTENYYQERYCGLVNFGNTCYSNSVLQALYFCKPFREKILEYKHSYKNRRHYKETLLTCLADLFYSIATRKKKLGSIAPKKFIARLRKEKIEFDNYNQQDAHEFLNFLINHINEAIQAERRCQQQDESATNCGLTNGKVPSSNRHSHHSHNHNHLQRGQNTSSNISSDNYSISTSSSTTTSTSGVVSAPSDPTWVHEIFQGILTSETRCLNCEKISCKDEDFFDLQIDVEQNTSITYCLKSFSDTETLRNENKFKCDNCRSYQEAQKKMRVKKLPLILALHLKRFKYIDQFNKHTKISHRVVFPLELRLFNTSDDAVNPDRLYDLISVVIHCGSGPNRGHYISIVKGANGWLLFDDETYEAVDVSTIEEFFGSTSDNQKTSETGYILFYQSRDRNF